MENFGETASETKSPLVCHLGQTLNNLNSVNFTLACNAS